MLVPLRVYRVVFDQSMSPVVLLVDKEEKKVLPIWVGPFEAQAIALALEGIKIPRPMTHDLLNNVCQKLGARIKKVVIHDLKEGTYYAEICIVHDEQEIYVDSRPSDAIALALRAGADIFMTDRMAAFTLSLEELMSQAQSDSGEVKGSKGKEVKVVKLEDYKKKLH
ncbi:bifunctional nuclease family protein [Calderihabitans maritimus]|uniref:BFN domain-containing protein n=1 Tax=Calderihabitans maritimus TaxID=1246530 RepID=A0A1Z5HNM1_9FIRM|nr:bifunctional nuclease family protein [Calderihabitans maritimus]GAW91122.1 hypothetical protein Moth_1111 [Calderihabitans maritimus]